MIFDKIDKLVDAVEEEFEDLTVSDSDFFIPEADQYPVFWVIPQSTDTVGNVSGIVEKQDRITLILADYVAENADVGAKRRTNKTLFNSIVTVISTLNFLPAGQLDYFESVIGKNKVTGIKITIRM
jgi:hypothetical protein